MELVKLWAGGIVGVLVIGWGLKWAKTKGVDALVAYVGNKIMAALKDDSVNDLDLRAFQRDIIMAFVRLAEKKLPDSGMGPERKKWVLDFLTTRLPIFKGREAELGELIDKLVATLDCELKKIEGGYDSGQI